MKKVRMATLLVLVSAMAGQVTAHNSGSPGDPKHPAAAPDATATEKTVTATPRNYVTTGADGQLVAVDRQSGKARGLTAEEAAHLAEGLRQLVNQSSEGLVQVRRQDGSVSMDLQGRFQSVMVAKKEADGKITQGCVDNVDVAAAFFEIDPALIDGAQATGAAPAKQLEIR
jgi:hypothetical protein